MTHYYAASSHPQWSVLLCFTFTVLWHTSHLRWTFTLHIRHTHTHTCRTAASGIIHLELMMLKSIKVMNPVMLRPPTEHSLIIW